MKWETREPSAALNTMFTLNVHTQTAVQTCCVDSEGSQQVGGDGGGDVEEGCHMSSKTSVAESVSQKR